MDIKIISIIILLSTLISPICHAESAKEWYNHEIRKLKSASILADYMYKRIKVYQKYGWYERQNLLWDMHEAIQNME